MPTEELRNSLKANHRLHWYLIDKVLGQGGFGITYLAHDPNLDQYVAIKEYLPMELAVRDGDNSVYPASAANGERYQWGLDRFIAEARTLARFKHPAIVRVLSVFEENNTAYMVMEYEQGQSFQQVLDQHKTLPEAQLLQILGPLLNGLELIHATGFIHRDIKPANIYIRSDKSPVLLDFGSARQALGEQTKSLTSIVSPGYAPFEQYYSKSDRQGPWTDIYSLAATMYRAITGLMPMDAIDRSEAILKAERDTFVSAEAIGQGHYSERFLHAIDHGLNFSEKKRPQTIDAWRSELGIEKSGSGTFSEPVGEPASAKTNFELPADSVPDSELETQIATRLDSAPLRNEELPAVSLSPADSLEVTKESSTKLLNEQRSRPWLTIIGATFLLAIGGFIGAVGMGGDKGFVENIQTRLVDILSHEESLSDLVSRGDRALSVGLIFEPFKGSALDYYRRAAELDPSNPAVRQGIDLTTTQVKGAFDQALEDTDLPRAEELLTLLASMPYLPFELAAERTLLEQAKAERYASDRESERIAKFLEAAEADLDAGRLTVPSNDNALMKYRAVQMLEPDNAAARDGIISIQKQLTENFHSQLAATELEQAGRTLEKLKPLQSEQAEYDQLAALLAQQKTKLVNERANTDKLGELLRLAEQDLARSRLTSPPGKNALERFQQALQLDPGNAQALAGIDQVADKYLLLTREAISNKSSEKAERYLNRLRKMAPNHGALAELKQSLLVQQRLLAEQENARLLEQQRIAIEQQVRDQETERQRLADQQAAKLQADEQRRKRQEAEAKRLFEEEEKRAELAKAAQLSSLDDQSSLVVAFDGFDDQLELYGLRMNEVRADVEGQLRNAGYLIKLHHEALRIPEARLVIIRFRANLNSASGVFSYAASIALYDDVSYWPLDRHRTKLNALWERGNSGVAVQTGLAKARTDYQMIVKRLVHEVGQAPRVK